jgi:hypothetical protein
MRGELLHSHSYTGVVKCHCPLLQIRGWQLDTVTGNLYLMGHAKQCTRCIC